MTLVEYSISELAERYGVGRHTVFNWIRAGLLDARFVPGFQRRYVVSDLETVRRLAASARAWQVPRHGTRVRYRKGCRCVRCVDVGRRLARVARAAQRARARAS